MAGLRLRDILSSFCNDDFEKNDPIVSSNLLKSLESLFYDDDVTTLILMNVMLMPKTVTLPCLAKGDFECTKILMGSMNLFEGDLFVFEKFYSNFGY